MKTVNCTKPGYTSKTCSKIENIPYNLIFTTTINDSSILITMISLDCLNLSLANEFVCEGTIQPRLSSIKKKFSRRINQSDCSIHIRLNLNINVNPEYMLLMLKNVLFYFPKWITLYLSQYLQRTVIVWWMTYW